MEFKTYNSALREKFFALIYIKDGMMSVDIYSTIQYNTRQYSTIQYSAIQYNAVQYNII